MRDPLERLLSKVNVVDSGCWEWTASIRAGGYGQFSYQGTPCVAHRIAYRLMVGEIPEGLELDHLCRNRKCVNPKHLEVVTRKVNLNRGLRRTGSHKTHCIRGHELTEETTYAWGKKSGHRACRKCRQIYSAAWWVKKKESNQVAETLHAYQSFEL